MKKILLIVMSFLTTLTLIGCNQQDDSSVKDKIQFVPNEDYVGDPHPIVEEKMKLTPQEQEEFEMLQQEILSEKEGE